MARTSKQPNREDKNKAPAAADMEEKSSSPAGAGEAQAEEQAETASGVAPGSQANSDLQGKDEASPDAAADADEDSAGTLQDEIASERDRYLRLAAEYDNFRKRSAKELKTAYSDARADTITKLLPVFDNLERALKMECSDEPFYKGVEMTMTQLVEILESLGVVYIEAAGEPFDPNRHNAVAAIEDPGLGEKIVAEEYQKGFMLGERVIRFSTVVVAN